MTDFVIDGKLAEDLQEIAAKEHRLVKDVLQTMVDKYKVEAPTSEPKHKSKYPDWLPRTADSPDYDPIDDFIGMFDDDITDLSSMTKEDVMDAYRKKYGDFLDTNVVFAAAYSRDTNHDAAVKLVRSLRGETQIIPAPVLNELIYLSTVRVNYLYARNVFARTRIGFQIEALTPEDMLRMQQIMTQYASAELDFARHSDHGTG